ncbi:MAG: STAS domain-containing protein [Bryobacteraceae bacterium]|jgi:anti-sigma B factor antagonist
MDQLQIRSTEGPGGILILHLEGPLTLTTLFEFQDTVRQQQAKGLILALGGVPYMDSAGLGAILGAYVSCQRQGQKFALADVSRRVLTLLEVAKVDALVPRFDTLEAAESHLAGKAQGA